MLQRKVTRRGFLRLTTAAAAGVAFPNALVGDARAAAATSSPATPAKLGAQFIGKLDGPEIIRDVTGFPTNHTFVYLPPARRANLAAASLNRWARPPEKRKAGIVVSRREFASPPASPWRGLATPEVITSLCGSDPGRA